VEKLAREGVAGVVVTRAYGGCKLDTARDVDWLLMNFGGCDTAQALVYLLCGIAMCCGFP
jgi:hypothetical protein